MGRGRGLRRFPRLAFQDSDSAFGALFCREDRQKQRNRKEGAAQVDRSLSQHCCGLSAENVLSHPGSERRAEALAARSLHQDDQGQQDTDDHQNREKYRDKYRQPHKGGNMCFR